MAQEYREKNKIVKMSTRHHRRVFMEEFEIDAQTAAEVIYREYMGPHW